MKWIVEYKISGIKVKKIFDTQTEAVECVNKTLNGFGRLYYIDINITNKLA